MSVVVVGGGPAGLACAIELRKRGVDDVLVLDREASAGGIPRHCGHQGFGIRDIHRLRSGPRYAEHYVDSARRAGVEVLEESMVTGWTADGVLEVTRPAARTLIQADAVVLATGCRERPRAARLVPGSRPEGVMTTGTLQQLVQRGETPVGRRALVVGAEHVSFSALMTLAHGGARTAGIVTELPHHQSLAVFRAGAALRYRAPLWTRTAVSAIRGRPRVEEVELLDLDSGNVRSVACDTVVFTADWIPDHELAIEAGLEMDSATNGPRVDTGLRTSRAGVFAAGNVLHGAEPADVAALSGRHAAAAVGRWLEEPAWPVKLIPIVCRSPLAWVAPSALSDRLDAPPRGRFALRAGEFLRRPEIEIRQDGKTLWNGHARRLIPGRSTYLPADWIHSVDSDRPIEIVNPNRVDL